MFSKIIRFDFVVQALGFFSDDFVASKSLSHSLTAGILNPWQIYNRNMENGRTRAKEERQRRVERLQNFDSALTSLGTSFHHNISGQKNNYSGLQNLENLKSFSIAEEYSNRQSPSLGMTSFLLQKEHLRSATGVVPDPVGALSAFQENNESYDKGKPHSLVSTWGRDARLQRLEMLEDFKEEFHDELLTKSSKTNFAMDINTMNKREQQQSRTQTLLEIIKSGEFHSSNLNDLPTIPINEGKRDLDKMLSSFGVSSSNQDSHERMSQAQSRKTSLLDLALSYKEHGGIRHDRKSRTDSLQGFSTANDDPRDPGSEREQRTSSLFQHTSSYNGLSDPGHERKQRTDALTNFNPDSGSHSDPGYERKQRTDSFVNFNIIEYPSDPGFERKQRTDAFTNFNIKDYPSDPGYERKQRTDAFTNFNVKDYPSDPGYERKQRTDAFNNFNIIEHPSDSGYERKQRTDSFNNFKIIEHPSDTGYEREKRTSSILTETMAMEELKDPGMERKERTVNILDWQYKKHGSSNPEDSALERNERTETLLNLQEQKEQNSDPGKARKLRTDSILELLDGSVYQEIKDPALERKDRTEAILCMQEEAEMLHKDPGLERYHRTEAFLQQQELEIDNNSDDGEERQQRTDALLKHQDMFSGEHTRDPGHERQERTDVLLSFGETIQNPKQDSFERRQRTETFLSYQEKVMGPHVNQKERMDRTESILNFEDISEYKHDPGKERLERTDSILEFLTEHKDTLLSDEQETRAHVTKQAHTLFDVKGAITQIKADQDHMQPFEKVKVTHLPSLDSLKQTRALEAEQTDLLLHFLKPVQQKPTVNKATRVIDYLKAKQTEGADPNITQLDDMVQTAFKSTKRVNMAAVNHLMDTVFEEMKFQVLARYVLAKDGKKFDQDYIMTRLESMLEFMKSDIILEYFDNRLKISDYNNLLHSRTDAILDLVKEEAVHDFFMSHSLTRLEEYNIKRQADEMFGYIKKDILKAVLIEPEKGKLSHRQKLKAHDLVIQNGVKMFNKDSEAFKGLIKAGNDLDFEERRTRAMLTKDIVSHTGKVAARKQKVKKRTSEDLTSKEKLARVSLTKNIVTHSGSNPKPAMHARSEFNHVELKEHQARAEKTKKLVEAQSAGEQDIKMVYRPDDLKRFKNEHANQMDFEERRARSQLTKNIISHSGKPTVHTNHRNTDNMDFEGHKARATLTKTIIKHSK